VRYQKAGILYHPREPAAFTLAQELAKTVLHPLSPWLAQTGDDATCAANLGGTDLAVCVGGDGTVLWAARAVAPQGAHIVSVNMGRLGFLSEIAPESAAEQLATILDGAGMLDERSLVECRASGKGPQDTVSGLALNDVVVYRAAPGRPVDFSVAIDGVHLARLRADALIVATATGSTAYNLSAGGPVLMPQSGDLVLTPVAPHLSRMRPMVLPGDASIAISVENQSEGVVTADGEVLRSLAAGCAVVCRRSEHTAAFIRLGPPSNFFARLAEHLNLSTQGRDVSS
jgi:NAD+ kinase